MAKIIHTLLLASATLTLSGCFTGQTSITASQYTSKPYQIYINGKQYCQMSSGNDCTIQTRGTYNEIYIEAFLDGEKVGDLRTSRHVTLASILWMPFTYWSSYWLYRAFPEDIEIQINDRALRETLPEGQVSVWDRPFNSKKLKKEKPIVLQDEDNENLATEEDVEDAAPTPVRKKSVWD